MFNGLELIIFDLDYTLADTGEGIVQSFNRARREAGEPEVAAEKIVARIGHPIEETFRIFGSADPRAMRVLFRKIAREGTMAQNSFLLPGVAETLPRLKDRGYRMAVASTKSRPEIVAVLSALEVVTYFEDFCGSDEVENPKPAPDPLLLVMQRLSVSSGRTVFVGDHVIDIRAARAAGTRCIAILGGPCTRQEIESEKPDAIIDKFSDLLDLL